jgi:chemotaxis protein histidine kinase CheA
MSCCCSSSSSSSSDDKDPDLLSSSLLGNDRLEGGNRLETEVDAAKEAELRDTQQELRNTQQELAAMRQDLQQTKQAEQNTQQELAALKQAEQNTQQEMAAMRQELKQTKEAEQNTQQELDQLKEERKWLQQQLKEARGGVKQEVAALSTKELANQQKAQEKAKEKEQMEKAAKEEAKKEAGAKATKETEGLEEKPAAGPAFALAKEHVEKFSTDTRYFSYGDEHTFFNGLPLKREDIRRLIEQECCENDDGLYEPEYVYVALEPARERELKDPASGEIRIKDKGHEGMVIKDFANLEIAISCRLKIVHIVVIRLYTGKLYKPWNDALRGMAASNEDPLKKEKLLQWATCIAVLYEAIIVLSAATTPTTVFRGLSESWGMELPEEFFNPEKSKNGFAGGVELAFMSTTENKQQAGRAQFHQCVIGLSNCVHCASCRLRSTFRAVRKNKGQFSR